MHVLLATIACALMLFTYFRWHMAWLAPCCYSETITNIKLFFPLSLDFFLVVCVYWIEKIFFSLTISAFRGEWTINLMQCKIDKKKPQPTSTVWTETLKRNAVALWSVCLAGNEVWQKIRTSCTREDQALFKAFALAFGDVQNGVAFLYFKTNSINVSCSCDCTTFGREELA